MNRSASVTQRPIMPITDLRDMLRQHLIRRSLECMVQAVTRRQQVLRDGQVATYQDTVCQTVQAFYGKLPVGANTPVVCSRQVSLMIQGVVYTNFWTLPKSEIDRFAIPFSRLDTPDSAVLWGDEFWSGQFLGTVPGKRYNPGGYTHPGDYQDLTTGDTPGCLEISFFSPGVKLLCLRTVRPYPWVAGTSFHQSCGTELKNVSWNPASHVLKGEVHRPHGETGYIAIPTAGMVPLSQEVDGRTVLALEGANGALILPVTLGELPARWSVQFDKEGD